MRAHPRPLFCGILTALLLAGCAGSPTAPSTPDADATDAPDPVIVEGLFDVGGYSLNLKCQGSGSPTIVYFHGSDFDGGTGARSASSLPILIRDDHRICVYDRLGAGGSDDRPDLTTGTEAVRGLNALLAAAEIEPPYVLLAASFGGLVAYEYLMTYPDDVQGMLLLDASFPDELALDVHFPVGQRYEDEDWSKSEENINQFFAYTEAAAMRGGEPDIPVTYLRATPQTWTLGVPAYDAVILDTQEAYVASFPQGVFKEVESPHFMEASVPDRIVDELNELIARI